MHWLIPKEKKFFDMLAKEASISLNAAGELKDFLEGYAGFERNERKIKASGLKSIRNDSEEIYHDIRIELGKNPNVPIDKEDIGQMAFFLDGISKGCERAASRFVILSIERMDNYSINLARIAFEAAFEVQKSISALKNLKDMKKDYERIKNLQKESKDLYDEALSELYHFHKNSIDIIRYREIYDIIAQITDCCESIANLVEIQVFRHS